MTELKICPYCRKRGMYRTADGIEKCQDCCHLRRPSETFPANMRELREIHRKNGEVMP